MCVMWTNGEYSHESTGRLPTKAFSTVLTVTSTTGRSQFHHNPLLKWRFQCRKWGKLICTWRQISVWDSTYLVTMTEHIVQEGPGANGGAGLRVNEGLELSLILWSHCVCVILITDMLKDTICHWWSALKLAVLTGCSDYACWCLHLRSG